MEYNTDTINFYRDLPIVQKDLSQITEEDYVSVPKDWLIVASDIVNSTSAFMQGKDTEIHISAGLVIWVVLSIAKDLSIPYMFGGDGSVLAIPLVFRKNIEGALAELQKDIQQKYDLRMRIGIIPIEDIQKEGGELRIAKIAYSPYYSQPFFLGGGMVAADWLLKKREELYAVQLGKPVLDMYEGLEFQQKDVFSEHGEMVSLLILPKKTDTVSQVQIFSDINKQIELIYGDRITRHPIHSDLLKRSYAFYEKHSKRTGPVHIFQSIYSGVFSNIWKLSFFWVNRKKRPGAMFLNEYKQVLIETTDNEKIGDYLGAVISGTNIQRKKLLKYLQKREEQGEIFYGYFTTDKAILTRLGFKHLKRRDVHFLDAAGGGYLRAAMQIKKKLKKQRKKSLE